MYSPPPPPQAARAFVRQIFRLGPQKPDVVATLLSEPDGAELEFVNSGGPAHSIAWTTGTASGTAGDLCAYGDVRPRRPTRSLRCTARPVTAR